MPFFSFLGLFNDTINILDIWRGSHLTRWHRQRFLLSAKSTAPAGTTELYHYRETDSQSARNVKSTSLLISSSRFLVYSSFQDYTHISKEYSTFKSPLSRLSISPSILSTFSHLSPPRTLHMVYRKPLSWLIIPPCKPSNIIFIYSVWLPYFLYMKKKLRKTSELSANL